MLVVLHYNGRVVWWEGGFILQILIEDFARNFQSEDTMLIDLSRIETYCRVRGFYIMRVLLMLKQSCSSHSDDCWLDIKESYTRSPTFDRFPYREVAGAEAQADTLTESQSCRYEPLPTDNNAVPRGQRPCESVQEGVAFSPRNGFRSHLAHLSLIGLQRRLLPERP